MRVVKNNTDRLVLRGTPGSVLWMVFATLFGLTLMVATAGFAWISIKATGGYLQLIPIGFGFLMGAGFFFLGLVTLTVGRMQLILDRVNKTGSYNVYSPIIDVGKPCDFSLEAIDSVTVERSEESRPADEHGSFPAKVCRAKLRIRKPRRVIVLDETENGQDRRVSSIADAVAEWLDIDVS